MSDPKAPFRTTVDDVPLEQNLREDEGWIDMRVQYLINSERGGSDGLTVGRTVLPPGARHDRHLHTAADEFLVVMSGRGEIHTNTGREPSQATPHGADASPIEDQDRGHSHP